MNSCNAPQQVIQFFRNQPNQQDLARKATFQHYSSLDPAVVEADYRSVMSGAIATGRLAVDDARSIEEYLANWGQEDVIVRGVIAAFVESLVDSSPGRKE